MSGASVSGIHLAGDHASRPAGNAQPDGSLYSCTTHSLIYKSNYAGNSWSTWATLTGTGYAPGGTDVALADGGTGASLTDPNADRIMFWDDSAGSVAFLTAGTNLTITGTTIDAASGAGDLAGKELDYAQVTSNTNITATTEATANTIVTGASVAYDGSTIVMVEFWCNHAAPDPANASRDIRFWLYDGSSSIGFIAYIQQTGDGGNSQYVPVHGMRRITPSNASHTYSIRASVNAGTGLVAAGAGGNGNVAPAFIRITRVSS